MNDIERIFEIFKGKFQKLKNVKLTFIDKSNDIEGKCMYDTIGTYENINKGRIQNINPIEIIVYNIGDIILTLLHEISHALTMHYERKVGYKEYVYVEHSHLFYAKFLEIMNFAYEYKIINKKYDLKSLKFIDKNS